MVVFGPEQPRLNLGTCPLDSGNQNHRGGFSIRLKDRNTSRLLSFCQLGFAQRGDCFVLYVVHLGRLCLPHSMMLTV